MATAARRHSAALNSGRRLSDATRRMQKASMSISRTKPILHMKQSISRPFFGSAPSALRLQEVPSILDPVEIKEEPAEIQSPMQVYPTTQGRYIWANWDWTVTSLGFTFNVSNVIRCPFLCASYGGATFLVMYLLMALLCAFPCCFLEAIVGQFTRSGSLAAWKISPLFKGLGFCFLLLNFFTTFFDNVMTTWAISYVVAVGRSIFGDHDYDWMSCNKTWTSKTCIPFDSIRRYNPSRNDSNSEYFRGYILGQKNLTVEYGLSDMTFPGIEVALTLAGVTIIVFSLAMEVGSKGLSRISILLFGISSSYIWLLLIRTASLPGGSDGVNHFLKPDWSQMRNLDAWLDAARLVCTTCGVGLGIHLSQASYNPFSTPILVNVMIPIGVSFVYGVFSTMITFSLFGFAAKVMSRNIKKLVQIHPEFVFEYIPITLPYDLSFPTHFYFMAIFTVIFCTSISGTIVRLVNLRLCFAEVFGHILFAKRLYKFSALLAFTIVSYALNLPLISNASPAWTTLHQLSIDNIAQPFAIFLEVTVLAWVVGAKFLNEAHISCTGKKVGFYFIIWWKFVIPPLILVMFIFGITKLTLFAKYRRVSLPSWSPAIGLSVVAVMVIIVVAMGIYTFVMYKGTASKKLKLLLLMSPDFQHQDILISRDGERFHFAHYKSLGSTDLKYIKPGSFSKQEIEIEAPFEFPEPETLEEPAEDAPAPDSENRRDSDVPTTTTFSELVASNLRPDPVAVLRKRGRSVRLNRKLAQSPLAAVPETEETQPPQDPKGQPAPTVPEDNKPPNKRKPSRK